MPGYGKAPTRDGAEPYFVIAALLDLEASGRSKLTLLFAHFRHGAYLPHGIMIARINTYVNYCMTKPTVFDYDSISTDHTCRPTTAARSIYFII